MNNQTNDFENIKFPIFTTICRPKRSRQKCLNPKYGLNFSFNRYNPDSFNDQRLVICGCSLKFAEKSILMHSISWPQTEQIKCDVNRDKIKSSSLCCWSLSLSECWANKSIFNELFLLCNRFTNKIFLHIWFCNLNGRLLMYELCFVLV